jgi:hypothetical protein
MSDQMIEKAKTETPLAVVARITAMLNEWTYSINEASKLEDFADILDRQTAMNALLNTRAAAKGLGDKLEYYRRKTAEMEAKADRRLGELARLMPESKRAAEVRKLGVTPKRLQESIKASELPQKQFEGYLKATERETSTPRTKDVARLAELSPADRKKAFATFGESAKVKDVIEAATKPMPEPMTRKQVSKPGTEPNARFIRFDAVTGALSQKSAELHQEAAKLLKTHGYNLAGLRRISNELRQLHMEYRESYIQALEQLDKILAGNARG